MTDYEVGDKVRLTHESVIESFDGRWSVLESGKAFRAGGGWNIEVIEKRKPKVGDVLNSREDLFKLPPDSVAVNYYGYPLIVTSSTTLLTRKGSTVRPTDRVFASSPYTIIHIPDWAK